MKKVGIVTLYGNYNMGNKLQSYAVMQLYRSLGDDVTFVNPPEWQLWPEPYRTRMKLFLKAVALRVNPNLRCIQSYKVNTARRRLFLDFSKQYLSPSETVSIRHFPSNFKNRYDFFSVGSDQVWHNWTHRAEELRFFFLRFADRQQRLCLSPSFGREEIPEEEAEVYREGLNGFPCLSCREASGVGLIRDLTGRDAALLCDPTMGLSAGEWERLEKKTACPLPERYVLFYALGPANPATARAVSRYANLLGAEVVDINDIFSPEYYAATGPQEFLYLIRHARLVCTNSFHATVFSILFRKNFVCFSRDDVSMHGDMSNRIDTLLDRFGLSSRRYGTVRDEELLSTDYTGTEKTLSVERERILDYLREAMDGGAT